MTHTRQMGDHEGVFTSYLESTRRCVFSVDGRPDGQPCDAAVKVRKWESSDGAYEDYQYRCAAGHTWWVDGIDS